MTSIWIWHGQQLSWNYFFHLWNNVWDIRALVLSNRAESWCLRSEWPVWVRWQFLVSWADWDAWAGRQGCGLTSGPWHLCWRMNLSSLVTYLSIGVDALACESSHRVLVTPLCQNVSQLLVLCVTHSVAWCRHLVHFLHCFCSEHSSSTTVPLQPLFMLVQSLQTCLVCLSLMLRKLSGSYCGHPQYTAFPLEEGATKPSSLSQNAIAPMISFCSSYPLVKHGKGLSKCCWDICFFVLCRVL